MEKNRLHTLLQRQIKRHFGDASALPEEMKSFLEVVNDAYREFDADRIMLERSMELSSQELVQANTDMRAVLEGLVDVFFRIDREGTILDCRVGLKSKLLLSEAEILGKRIQHVPDKSVGALFQKALETVNADPVLHTFVYQLHSEGTTLHYEARLLPLSSGQIIVIIRDITRRQKARERELALQDRLNRAQRMESLGMLAGGVAHDLNNILGPLAAYPDLMTEMLPDNHPVQVDISRIRESALKASAMVQDLLTLARRGANRTEPVHLNDIIRNYIASLDFQELSGSRPNTTWTLNLGEHLPFLEGTSHGLRQCIMNLVRNAFEAIPDTGRVTIRTQLKNVNAAEGTYEMVPPGTYVLLSIADTGPGIQEEDVEHIFEPFFTKKKLGRSGSGLGLSVVYGVTHDCNGYVDVRTTDRKGSTFSLYFPVSKTPCSSTKKDLALQKGGRERILVVDDSPQQREVASRVLKRLGYTVDTAENGHAAVEFMMKNSVDLVMLDMIMEEGFGGLETYREMVKLHPKQRCIIVSGYAENEDVAEAQRLGAGKFVSKPYTIRQLDAAVRAELDREVSSEPALSSKDAL